MFLVKNISIIIIFLLFFSCNANKTAKEKSEKIIPQDSMVKIISEIYLVDATLTTAINIKKIKPNEVNEYYSYLFDKHQITKEQFDK